MSNTTKSIKTRKYVTPDHEMVGEILGRSEKRGGRNEIASLQEIKDFDEHLEHTRHAKRTLLKACRESACLLLEEAANLVGLSKSGYVKIESGEDFPRLEIALRIAMLFNTTVEELFFDDLPYGQFY